jgi:hypothetical protein
VDRRPSAYQGRRGKTSSSLPFNPRTDALRPCTRALPVPGAGQTSGRECLEECGSLRQALAIYQCREIAAGIAGSRERIGGIEALCGDAKRAARLLGSASAEREQAGIPRGAWEQENGEQAVGAVPLAADDDRSIGPSGDPRTICAGAYRKTPPVSVAD